VITVRESVAYFNVITAIVVLIVMFTLLIMSVKYRREFREHYPRLASAYDWMILVWLGFSLAKFTVLPVELMEGGLLNLSNSTVHQLEALCNIICGVALALLIYGWFHLLKEMLVHYELVPVVELSGDGGTEKMVPGLYIVGVKNGLSLLKKLIGGRAVVIISRTPPVFFKNTLRIEKSPVLWLTPIGGKDTVHPRRLEYLTHLLVQFMRRNDAEKVIYLDGVEYLITENGFIPVFKFLANIKDHAVISNTVILVPIDPKSMGEKEFRLLTREFETIGDSGSGG